MRQYVLSRRGCCYSRLCIWGPSSWRAPVAQLWGVQPSYWSCQLCHAESFVEKGLLPNVDAVSLIPDTALFAYLARITENGLVSYADAELFTGLVPNWYSFPSVGGFLYARVLIPHALNSCRNGKKRMLDKSKPKQGLMVYKKRNTDKATHSSLTTILRGVKGNRLSKRSTLILCYRTSLINIHNSMKQTL